MEMVCPVCNEMITKSYNCSKCNEVMADKGRVQEYLGPYSAEMPIEEEKDSCIHVFQCTACGYMENKEINYVKM